MDTETLNEIAVEVVEAGTRDFYSQINSSVLLLLSIAIVWFFFSFVVFRRSGVSATERRRVRSAVRAVVALSLIVGLLYVWAPELRTFALSIVAFAVAIVIATKELILCFMGGIYRLTTGASKIGDTVHVGAMRGQIVDQTLLAMTLQELGPEDNPGTFTGRRMVIPNSVLLSSPISNESDITAFGLRHVNVMVPEGVDVGVARQRLLEIAEQTLAPLEQKSKAFWKELSILVDAEPSGRSPAVTIRAEERDKVTLVLHCFVPSDQWRKLREQILETYLTQVTPGSA